MSPLRVCSKFLIAKVHLRSLAVFSLTSMSTTTDFKGYSVGILSFIEKLNSPLWYVAMTSFVDLYSSKESSLSAPYSS